MHFFRACSLLVALFAVWTLVFASSFQQGSAIDGFDEVLRSRLSSFETHFRNQPTLLGTSAKSYTTGSACTTSFQACKSADEVGSNPSRRYTLSWHSDEV